MPPALRAHRARALPALIGLLGGLLAGGPVATADDHTAGAGPAVVTYDLDAAGGKGLWRSTDAGATWVRTHDDRHPWGWTGAAVTGDPKVFVRVYVATNGRGIVYGDTTAR